MSEVCSSETSETVESRDGIDPERWLDRYGDMLFGYAVSRLGRLDEAEDAVQETLLGALASRESYSGRASERNWLMGILKHKVIDQLRQRHHHRAASQAAMEEAERELDSFFDRWGHWKHAPRDWPDASSSAEKAEFWAAFRQCMGKLPRRLADAFSLRVLDQSPPENVCEILSVTPGNFRVILHRARLRLRECLEVNWFETAARGES